MIRVVVADDSPFTCRLVASYLECAGDCQVVGTAHDAASTLALVVSTAPDVVTLDLEMPGADGLELLRSVVRQSTSSVVVISGVSRRAASMTLRALEIGAVDFVLKYMPGASISPASLQREIVSKVRAAAALPRRGTAKPRASAATRARTKVMKRRHRAMHDAKPPIDRIIVIGASTGGPAALRRLLAQLPANFPTPCVVVQHLPAPFTVAFAEELERYTRLPVREAKAGASLSAPSITLTPGSSHLLVRPSGVVELRPATEVEVYRPSINFTMVSSAESFGTSAVGVVLSGIGDDGAEGLKRIRLLGGRGYVQDPASCVADSMPARALQRAGADFVGRPEVIGSLLVMRGQSA